LVFDQQCLAKALVTTTAGIFVTINKNNNNNNNN
jgi:hypothetical protein